MKTGVSTGPLRVSILPLLAEDSVDEARIWKLKSVNVF